MLTTDDAAKLLNEKGIKLLPKQLAQLAQNGVFPNAEKGEDQRWKIPEGDINKFIRLRQKRKQSIITVSAVTSVISILGIISVTNNAFGLIEKLNSRATPTLAYSTQLLYDGCKFFEDSNYLRAEEKFNLALELEPSSPEPWYWKARLAKAYENKSVAIEYINKALETSPRHSPSVILKIMLFLTTSQNEDAELLANRSRGITDDLDTWLYCLYTNNFFSPNIITESEINSRCPVPVYRCDAMGK